MKKAGVGSCRAVATAVAAATAAMVFFLVVSWPCLDQDTVPGYWECVQETPHMPSTPAPTPTPEAMLSSPMPTTFQAAKAVNTDSDLGAQQSSPPSIPTTTPLLPCDTCEVCGIVDDCPCTVEETTDWNEQLFYPLLSQLLDRPYFRYFRVNLYGRCTQWNDEQDLCSSQSCAVNECEAAIAEQLQDHGLVRHANASCQELNNVNVVSPELAQRLDLEYLRSNRGAFCAVDEEAFDEGDLVYVNLKENPERYTGFSGDASHRIWQAVYNTNCFLEQQPISYFDGGMDVMLDDFARAMNHEPELPEAPSKPTIPSIDSQSLCYENRVFYRLLSGVHASISLHLSHKWLDPETGAFQPNVDEFVRRFGDVATAGKGQTYLKNLYFTYLVVLRSISMSASTWREFSFVEQETAALIQQLLDAAQSQCKNTFDETSLIAHRDGLQDVRNHLRQITEVMNCVGCFRCRLWGKLQTRGLATALRILLSDEGEALLLSRNDVVALFTLWERLSASIHYIQDFRHQLATQVV
eukprot:m.270331 g.270331  ORF g.270331 m.270331 type:complete len:524 (-) comp15679_c0_seq1:571-2142(-)